MVADESLSESLIPDFVWDFVKKIIKSPVAQGILAMMIGSYLSKNTDDVRSRVQKKMESFFEDNTMGNSGAFLQTKIPNGQSKLNFYRVKLLNPDDKTVEITVSAKDEATARRDAKHRVDKQYKRGHQVLNVRKESLWYKEMFGYKERLELLIIGEQ